MSLVNIRIKGQSTDCACIRDGNEFSPLRPGEIVAVSKEEADSLVKGTKGRIEITDEPANRESPPGVTDAPEVSSRIDQIILAIGELNKNDQSKWTKAGKPEVASLEAVLGYDIKAAERDKAWDQYNSGE